MGGRAVVNGTDIGLGQRGGDGVGGGGGNQNSPAPIFNTLSINRHTILNSFLSTTKDGEKFIVQTPPLKTKAVLRIRLIFHRLLILKKVLAPDKHSF